MTKRIEPTEAQVFEMDCGIVVHKIIDWDEWLYWCKKASVKTIDEDKDISIFVFKDDSRLKIFNKYEEVEVC